jgi:hypothetical protein
MPKSNPADILTALGRWRGFDKELNQLDREDATFKLISDIFVDTIIANSNSNFTIGNYFMNFLQNLTMALMSVDGHHAARPDGYLPLKDKLHGIVVSPDMVLRASTSGRTELKN